MAEKRTVQYGTTSITYTLDYARRKTLGITVQPDLSVRVRAPVGTPKRQVDALVVKRAPWILRHQQELRTASPPQPPHAYVSGETHYYLGKPYRLKVLESPQNMVKVECGWLRVFTRQKDADSVQRVLERWARARAKAVFTERLTACYPRMAHTGILYPELLVRKMKSSWGNARGTKITLNVRLVQMPVESIDYVIFHELCHLAQPNHSKKFYALLDRVLPDWRERKERMKKFGALR
ncbi:MAG: SprT family zinc-dependent metalloprotease [Anaerolineae bacterium]|nr:SprT family zinc-dependent metalloprotease [Anaerolineae bacterium]